MPRLCSRVLPRLILTGDNTQAETELRAAHDLWMSTQPNDPCLSRAKAELGLLAYRRGDLEEAEALAAAARHAATHDLESQLRWRIATSLIEARHGQSGSRTRARRGGHNVRVRDRLARPPGRGPRSALTRAGGPSAALHQALELSRRRGNLAAIERLRRLRQGTVP
jgi:hypothetical protein